MIDLVEEKIELTQFSENPGIIKKNKLEGITEVVFSLDKLDSTDNLKNEPPSYTLFMYQVTAHKDSTHFEPYTPQYNKLKKGELVSLALRMKHMKSNIMTDGPATTVVLHFR